MNVKNYHNLSSVWTHLLQKTVTRGEGCYLYTEDGDKILDCTSGIGVNSTGHCHPNVVEAIKNQAETLIFSQVNCACHSTIFELTEELKTILPKELNRCFYAQSGAEAVEAAVKLAKHATGRSNIVVFNGSFHGRTHLTMAMTTSKTIYRKAYPHLPGGIYTSPYPYALKTGRTEDEEVYSTLESLEMLFETQCAADEVAAIVVEPVLGEGGYLPAPVSFLKGLREICDKYGILLIADEIQTGFGRTGKMFAMEWSGIIPDIMTMAKGLASGVPLSGIAYREELDEKWIKGSHGGTYGGNPIGCSAAIATIRTLKEEQLVENSHRMGELLKEKLNHLKTHFPVIGDVRGLGLMIGVELLDNGIPNKELPGKIISRAIERNLLLLSCGVRKNVLRIIPPLIISEEEVELIVSTIKSILEEIYGDK